MSTSRIRMDLMCTGRAGGQDNQQIEFLINECTFQL